MRCYPGLMKLNSYINPHPPLLPGVAQLINKDNGAPFTDCDVSLFEAFAIFCGLGIHNTQMYENACKLMAKQKVALECLSYHATASNDATDKLIKEEVPSAENYNLYSFTFIDFELSDEDTCKATIRMFLECNLVQQFHIPYEVSWMPRGFPNAPDA
jgi:cGMP-specific 3',5'-cyclic phosphodiesterase